MVDHAAPVILRRRFGAELRRLREARSETLSAAASALMISTSKLSRIENGQGELQPRDVRDLLQYFGGDDTDLGHQMASWAERSRRPVWWQELGYSVSPPIEALIAYESAADEISTYASAVIPDLLQTREYASAVLAGLSPRSTKLQIRQQVDLRQKRRDQLDSSEDPPKQIFVLPETVLRRQAGDANIMAAQLARLISAYEDPSIDLHVVPFAAGIYPAMEGSFTVFHFRDERDPDVVARETSYATSTTDNDIEVQRYREQFDDVARRWLSRVESLRFIRKLLESGETSWSDS